MKVVKIAILMICSYSLAFGSQNLLDELDLLGSSLQDSLVQNFSSQDSSNFTNYFNVDNASNDDYAMDQKSLLEQNSVIDQEPLLDLSNNKVDSLEPADLSVHAGKNLEAIVLQAKDLESRKAKIDMIVESCFDVIDQLEVQRRKQLSKLDISPDVQEDRVQEFLTANLQMLTDMFLALNKDFVIKIINSSSEPVKRIDFMQKEL